MSWATWKLLGYFAPGDCAPGAFLFLMLASKAGLTPLARRLLDHGARTDLRDASGRTALVYATQNSQRGLAMVLRRHEKVNASSSGKAEDKSEGTSRDRKAATDVGGDDVSIDHDRFVALNQ